MRVPPRKSTWTTNKTKAKNNIRSNRKYKKKNILPGATVHKTKVTPKEHQQNESKSKRRRKKKRKKERNERL